MNLSTLRTLPVQALRLSETHAQAARRKYFDQVSLQELADSIKSLGIINPVVARPLVDGKTYEIVAGERRFLAAKLAGLVEVPTSVRDLTDKQVIEVQLVENLQREGLNELAEAEGYEQLLKQHGYEIDDLIAKVGKSRAYIYGRLKLLDLTAPAREAMQSGEMSASIALLIARIPGEEQQTRALKVVTEKDYYGRTMSYRQAADYIHANFMLKLSGAPFDTDDATLVPEAGACGPCPMRAGNTPDLFGDVKGADVCTNPQCFAGKKAAHIKRELEKARADGDKVIRGGDARRILPNDRGYYSFSSDGSHKQLRNGFARPRDICLTDPKKRTYGELAGKDAPKVKLQNPDTGRVEQIFEIAAIADRLKAKGVKSPKPAENTEERRRQDNEQREREQDAELAARRAIFRAVIKAAPEQLARVDLVDLCSSLFHIGYGSDEDFYSALGWDVPKKGRRTPSGRDDAFRAKLLALSEGELCRAAVALTVVDDVLECYNKPEGLEALAKRLGVNTEAIRKQAEGEPEAPPRAAPVKKTKPKVKKAVARAKAKK